MIDKARQNGLSRVQRLAITIGCLLTGTVLTIVVGRTLVYGRPCWHGHATRNIDLYQVDVNEPKLTGAASSLYSMALSGTMVGQELQDLKSLLAEADRSDLTDQGAWFQFMLPCNHAVVSQSSRLWLYIEVDYRCGHVVECSVQSAPLF